MTMITIIRIIIISAAAPNRMYGVMSYPNPKLVNSIAETMAWKVV